MSQARKDDDAHVVLDGAVETVAATVRGEITANGTVQTLAMGVLSADPADPLGVAATLRITDRAPSGRTATAARPDQGLKAYPGYLRHGPASPGYAPYHRLAAHYQIPVIFHAGDTYGASAKLKYAHPLLVDETNFVIAHCGHPWFLDDTEMIYRNANIWADLSRIFVGDKAVFAALARLIRGE